MKKLGTFLLGVFAVLPVYAQDQPADAAPATTDAAAAPADAAPADATAVAPASDAAAPAADTAAAPADATTPSSDAAPAADASAAAPAADASAAPAADASSGEAAPAPAADASAPTDSGSTASSDASAVPAADATPAEPRKPWPLYVGYDYVQANFLASTSDPLAAPNKATQFSSDNLHGNFHQIRAGFRIFDVVGIEAHYGIKSGNGDKPDTMGIKNNMGLYFVPTGSLFDIIEISALIGYASTKLEHGGQTLSIHGSSYGANVELPLRPLLGDWMPDLRLGGGIMVYHHDQDSRIYGTHFGVRYDFKV